MLELHIMKFLMKREQQYAEIRREGRLRGYSVIDIQKQLQIPQGTFYRKLAALIASGVIVKQRRNSYIISNDFRELCNAMLDSTLVVS